VSTDSFHSSDSRKRKTGSPSPPVSLRQPVVMTTRIRKGVNLGEDDDTLFKDIGPAPKGSVEEENQRLREKLKYDIFQKMLLQLPSPMISPDPLSDSPKKFL
jgi:hypothetical protein